MPNHFTKTALLAIMLLVCPGCLVVPLPVPIPISSNEASSTPGEAEQPQKLDPKYAKTCFADSLTEIEARKVTRDSVVLETEADKLAAQGRHQEALKKYNEVGAALLNENQSVFDEEPDDVETWVSEHKDLLQRSAQLNFKIGLTYAQLNKPDLAIKCFDETLKEHSGIAPPNNAAALLNRGDAYLQLGNKKKALEDYQEAAQLFKKYKLPNYQKRAFSKIEAVK